MAKITVSGVQEIKNNLEGMFQDMAPDFRLVGQTGAEAIVRATLAGIGEADTPFAPYSPAYAALIASVGGKPQQTVNLRGLFYPPGTEPDWKKLGLTKRGRKTIEVIRRRGGGRRAYVSVAFARGGLAGYLGGVGSLVRFTGRTPTTRPQLGLTDPLSEMSLDLITVEASGNTLRIVYTPRSRDYMIAHQRGEGRMPRRTWFTLNRHVVLAAMRRGLEICLAARVKRAMGQTTPADVRNP
jgi:hypothetical protein